jgi:hypothetical protein
MAIHEPLESISNRTQNPEIKVPFSNEDIRKLRIHILESSGAFSNETIAQQIQIDYDPSLISKFITIEVIQNKNIDPVRIAASLEKDQYDEAQLLSVSFNQFREDIFDFEDQLIQLHDSEDHYEKKFAEELEALFKTDPIIIALRNGVETLMTTRSLEGVRPEDVSTTILSLERAIKTQKIVLTSINKLDQ